MLLWISIFVISFVAAVIGAIMIDTATVLSKRRRRKRYNFKKQTGIIGWVMVVIGFIGILTSLLFSFMGQFP